MSTRIMLGQAQGAVKHVIKAGLLRRVIAPKGRCDLFLAGHAVPGTKSVPDAL